MSKTTNSKSHGARIIVSRFSHDRNFSIAIAIATAAAASSTKDMDMAAALR